MKACIIERLYVSKYNKDVRQTSFVKDINWNGCSFTTNETDAYVFESKTRCNELLKGLRNKMLCSTFTLVEVKAKVIFKNHQRIGVIIEDEENWRVQQ